MENELLKTIIMAAGAVFTFLPLVLVIFVYRYIRKSKADQPKVIHFKPDKLRYKMSFSNQDDTEKFVAVGSRFGFSQNISVSAAGLNPKSVKNAISNSSEDAILEVSSNSIVLTEKGKKSSYPKDSLTSLMCCSARSTSSSPGQSFNRIYVCLCFNDKKLGNIAVASYEYEFNFQSIFGKQQDGKYTTAFSKAETTAKDIATALAVPYHENYYTGMFSGMAGILEQ